MTQFIVVAVRDSALDAFMQPFHVPTTGMAIRSFMDEVNRVESPLNAHPSDYELFQLATWNDSDGVFHQLSTPVSLVRAVDAVVKS